MSASALTGIGELATADATHPDGDGSPLGLIQDAAVVVEDGRIEWVGRATAVPATDDRRELGGRAVIPSFVDSHSHLVFAGDRSAEFAARMTGEPYDGGGIAVSMQATRAASDDELRALVGRRIAEMHAQGTGVVEIKSGYGLDVDNEARALRIASEFTDETTFLGAHVVPPEFRESATGRTDYLDLVCGEMLAACAPYARWIDVFCEPNSAFAFTGEESERVLRAGADAGLELRVHGNQLGHGPGVQLAVSLGAASVDHCTFLSDADIAALAGSSTVATLLPGVEFSTKSPYPDARRLIDAGVSVALASDCNPGTCYSSSIPFAIAVAVRDMGMTPAEALLAATSGAAKSLRRTDIGVIRVGARADLTVLDAPSYLHLAYRPGVPIARALTAERPTVSR
ncbi:MAG TPA: imidazolonepropionase [Flexivirga sp.]|uniref:imidazolonepropionase n=1 Tax=Flexivirga sp. TaxID=1962927 RepID=UPI002CCE89AC|nr:imidazolonepropionase [Flexivirga sp.]HWC21176.1 imidazolonepropionase [Flexivirga sp.]